MVGALYVVHIFASSTLYVWMSHKVVCWQAAVLCYPRDRCKWCYYCINCGAVCSKPILAVMFYISCTYDVTFKNCSVHNKPISYHLSIYMYYLLRGWNPDDGHTVWILPAPVWEAECDRQTLRPSENWHRRQRHDISSLGLPSQYFLTDLTDSVVFSKW